MIYDVPFIGRFIHFFRNHTDKTEAALTEAENSREKGKYAPGKREKNERRQTRIRRKERAICRRGPARSEK